MPRDEGWKLKIVGVLLVCTEAFSLHMLVFWVLAVLLPEGAIHLHQPRRPHVGCTPHDYKSGYGKILLVGDFYH